MLLSICVLVLEIIQKRNTHIGYVINNLRLILLMWTLRADKNIFYLILFSFILTIGCNEKPTETNLMMDGYNMLLIGNSFFRPYAQNLEQVANDAGFDNHNAIGVFRGGDNGRPINFWNDSETEEHLLIKSTLDKGNIEIFGLTAGHETDNPTEGHKAWINYAIQKNPNIKIFIAIPPIDFPAEWNQRAEEYGFNTIQELNHYFVNEIVHYTMVNSLRKEFPNIKIFTIPTGWAAINLAQMQLDNSLQDNISMFGQEETSIFTDYKGHQGQVVVETGTLIWLNCIYNVDLTQNEYKTGFVTDLHNIAKDIVDNHDTNYK